MTTFSDTLSEFWDLTIGYFFNPNKRIHLVYLLSSLLLAYYVFYRTKRKGSFIHYVFNKKVWLSKSASIDYMMFLCNGLLKLFLIMPYVYFGFVITFEISDFLTRQYGYVYRPLSFEKGVIYYTIVLTLLSDFVVYLTHLAMHKIPFLWEFHKIHHSATSMNPITQYRLHPIELFINNIQGMLIFGVVTGFFNYWTTGQVSKWVFLGVNVFSMLFFILGANLRHSHVKLRYLNFLEYIFISPAQHQIHHSKFRKHWNKNMGSRLAIWDWLFGTLLLSKGVTKISFGLGGKEDQQYISFMQNMLNPFRNNFRRIRKYVRFS